MAQFSSLLSDANTMYYDTGEIGQRNYKLHLVYSRTTGL